MTTMKEQTKKKKLILDKRSYLVFAIIGVLLILLLLLMRTRFSEDMRLSDDGFAIVSGTVTESLSADPTDYEASISEIVSLYSFSALDYVYTQNQYHYLGADEKTKIDVSYPLYMKNGNVLQIVDNSGVLFDETYDQIVTYKGMYLQGGYSFNINGEQADPMKFLFLELNNGNHINLATIEYEDKGREYDINENSIIHFDNDYFSYYEYEEGTLLYKYKISVTDDTILTVGGVEHTYDELLKLLRLRSDIPEFDAGEIETTTPEEEPTTTVVEDVTTDKQEIETSSKVESEETTKEKETGSKEEETTIEQGGNDSDKVSPGVRPDHMRPDKDNNKDEEEAPEKVPDYVKPTVTVTKPFEANVYRLIAEIEVKDPVKRIDKKKMIQFEVYEIGERGKETLVTRGYCQGTGKVILGGGGVKPDSDYRVVGYFTYNDEYNKSQVEQLGEWKVTTKGIDTLGVIKLLHEQNVTYSDRIELENVGYDIGSDEEAVYGINPTAGITLIVRDEDGREVLTKKVVPNSDVTNFKRQARLVISTLGVLDAKSTFEYEFVFKDFFDNTLKLENAKGTAITCNHTPKASISLEKNEIADVQLKVSINDVDDALIPAQGKASECDIYLILAKKGYGVASLDDEEVITYYKMKPSDYTYTAENGIELKNVVATFTNLDLDETMYAYVYCDYDLQNNFGPQRFKEIGQMRFTTSGFASLGKVYVDVHFDEEQLTHSSVPITYTLNNVATNTELSKLIVGFETDVVGGTGDDKLVYTTLGFNKNNTEQDGRHIYQMFRDGEDLTYTAKDLDSMTTYTLEPRVYLEYNGKIYDNVSVELSKESFKTLRKPAEVVIDNLLFAAGTIIFDATVIDKDETIIGPSGDKVVVNLYTTTGEFVRATRIVKNQPEPETITFENLDVNKNYELRFTAVEYNEGYSNSSYESNKMIRRERVMSSVRLDGTIKLQEIKEIPNDSLHFNSIVKVVMSDEEHYLSGNKAIPYYVTIEKNGEVIATNEYYKNTEPVATTYSTNYEYTVDAGENTYKLTLYVIISGRTMVLDTLEFTSERTVKGFSTAYEMIKFIKENPNGKFVATNSFVLNSNSWNFPEIVDPGDVGALTEDDLANIGITLEEGISGAQITSIFDGEIDFQGFTLTHNYYADGHSMFSNIGANGELTNMVYRIYLLNEARIYDEGFICYRNFGHISDIVIEFAGSLNVINNSVFGFICRYNCSTAIVENFVISNNPGTIIINGIEENLVGVSAYQHFGTIASHNYGIVRYGYVYGDNIIATAATGNIDRRIGGIVGTNEAIGKVYSVYSMLNVDQELRNSSSDLTYGYRYGAVCGYSSGVLRNIYSVAESLYKENKNNTIDYYQKSPVVGDTANRNTSVFFYSPSGFDYEFAVNSAIKNVKEIQLNNLYDPGWQKSMLTDEFDIAMVEVGYYPHVSLHEDLPPQKNTALPIRALSADIDISRASVKEYVVLNQGTDNETSAAIVEFVFSNRDGLSISKVDIDNLTVELDLKSAKTVDGYTTISGLVYNPQTFDSEYTIRKVSYYKKNTLKENTTDYTLYADFYRGIYTVEDWYNYVVVNANKGIIENVRIMNDIDFKDVDASKIMVTKAFYAKLDGNGKTLKNIDLQRGLKTTSYWTVRNLFAASPSIEYSGEVNNLTIEDYKAGGVYTQPNTAREYVARYGAVFRNVKGTVNGVNLVRADIKSFEQVGGIAAYVDVGGELINCTVQDLNITYLEPDNQNIDATVGGVVAYAYNARVTHCLATGVNILAEEMKGSNGIGGVIGYAVNTTVDTIYAEGDIETRGIKAGGAIGEYYATSSAVTCIKNTFAKVDIISYTDAVGGLIGQINITQERISDRNNFSGISFGNVYVANPDSSNITQTIGSNIGKNAKFYGTDEQLVNGMAGIDVNEHAETVIVDLLGYDDLSGDNAQSVYEDIIGFDDVYDYSSVKEGYLPQMYALDSKELLPQPKILLDDSAAYDIEVTDVYTSTERKTVTVVIKNPLNYKITGIDIEKFNAHYVDLTGDTSIDSGIDKASDYADGYTRIYLKYNDVQDYYLDSYVMKHIYFYAVPNSHEKTLAEVQADTSNHVALETFSRIGATLYKDITSEADWNNIAVRELQGHIYENYRIIADLDFSIAKPEYNLKIGRLIGTSQGVTIRNVDLDGTKDGKPRNLISRLNSGIENITFEKCKIASPNSNCTGIIGVNNGYVRKCNFKEIQIIPLTKDMDEAGIIAHQNGGELTNITLDNVVVSAFNTNKKGIDYVGALCGKLTDGSVISNVTANNIEVSGNSTVGGLVGQIYISQISDVTLTNLMVTSYVNYAGGLAGRLGTDSNGRAGAVDDVTVSGTVSYDANGLISSSSTTIETVTGSYIGGIAGHNYHKSGENKSSSVHKVTVDGVAIKGYASYIGGVFGYNYSDMNHLVCKNSLITTADTTNTGYTRVGGIIGYEEYGTLRYLTAENIYINSRNHNQVGGIVGGNNSSNLYYSTIKDARIDATSKTKGTWKQSGGAVGYQNAGSLQYLGVFNTIINAETMDCVGGIAGQMGGSVTSSVNIQRCFNISDYDEQAYLQYGLTTTKYSAAALDKYSIKGYNYVGGIVGRLSGGNIQYSYSNGNVIAGTGQCAGGIAGYYGNEYVPASNGTKSYSNAQLFRNYFAGTVSAPNGYAGGIIGRTGMLTKGFGTDSTGTITGSGDDGSRIKNVNGNANEKDRTYGNIVFADRLEGAVDKTRNFVADDKNYKFTGKNNTLWEGTKVNGIYTCNIVFNGNYAYNYWNATNALTTAYPLGGTDATKLLLFKYSDLDGSSIASTGSTAANLKKHNRAAMFYRNIGWSLQANTSSSAKGKDFANRNTVWAVYVGNVCRDSEGFMKNVADCGGTDTISGFKNEFEKNGIDEGSYLPQIRSSTTTKYANDYSMILQNMMNKLPLPADNSCVREPLVNLNSESENEIITYGYMYASDVDKVNVEFSKDLVGKGYFIIKVNDKEIAKQIISDRAYTFSYNYKDTVVLEYGVNNVPLEVLTYEADDLKNTAMVYKNSYYYISDTGIVSEDYTIEGQYRHIMNGKALDISGNIIDVVTMNKISTISAMIHMVDRTPLWSFKYMNYDILTFAGHSHIVSDRSDIVRDAQIFVHNDKLVMVDGSMDTNKTDILLYSMNGTEYLTVLGKDGFLVDLFNEDANIPKSVDNKAVVKMSNTIGANVPYVILQYSNGGMICYNYATGSVVFDKTIADDKSLFEYAVEFFSDNEQSKYAGISDTYKTNSMIASNIQSSKDLELIVGNNTNGEVDNEYSSGETGYTNGETESANEESTKLPDNDVSIETTDDSIDESDDVLPEETTSDETTTSDADTETEETTSGETTTSKMEDASTDEDVTDDLKETSDTLEDESEEVTEEVTEKETSVSPYPYDEDAKFMAVFNSNTGVYEIVNVIEYLSDDNYVSENVKLGIKDFASYENGFAKPNAEEQDETGIIFYIAPIIMIFMIFAGVEVYLTYKRNGNNQ